MANWDAMTAISTLSMTIATLAVAVIALQAKNSWKKEIREKKKYDLIREMKIKLTILTCSIIYPPPFIFSNLENENYNIHVKNELKRIHENRGRLGVIKEELDYLRCTKLSSELNKLLEIINPRLFIHFYQI